MHWKGVWTAGSATLTEMKTSNKAYKQTVQAANYNIILVFPESFSCPSVNFPPEKVTGLIPDSNL